ncbi:MAG: bifunctional diaminohydroxyphosphoribosylaminopyrimidine deaminase/5-amino-6-(5-phosphoribosylamino)uracil reductase RibD [Burkholderiaceae bacterium]
MFNDLDHQYMTLALSLAQKGLWTTTPNPRVGCVIVKDRQVVGEGWHMRAGQAHAEVMALEAAGPLARGATVYVTLEPCSHQGRTPPCAQALVRAQVGKVVAAMQDPNPQVSGRGLGRLREAGIEVRCGLLEAQARELNIGFVSRMTRGRPWVRAKIAASLDAVTALADGSSQWITGEAARQDGHHWRARACAILTGFGTVRDDNPQLTVRHANTERQPLRVVVDSRLETPRDAQVLADSNVLLVHAVDPGSRAGVLRDAGAQLLCLPNQAGKVDLAALLTELGSRGINELHCEAGYKLNGSLLREDCIDEWLIYLAPCFLGQGAGLANIAAVPSLDARQQFEFHSVDQIGADIRLLARRPVAQSSDTPIEALS